MQVRNSISTVRNIFCGKAFDLEIWREYASSISPSLALQCENDSKKYNFQREVLPVINAALENEEKLLITNNSFEAVAKDLSEKITRLFDREIELEIILYLGLCNAAGWASVLDGRDVILLGVEKIIELDWCSRKDMQALIFHEIGHIWHKTYGSLYFSYDSQSERSVLQLYQEGVAMVCEQILCGDHTYYHQDRSGWLDWCKQNEMSIKKEYLDRLENSRSTQDFFGDWCSYEGHSDVGYYLGCQYIKYLQKKYSMIEIADLPYTILRDELICFAGTGNNL